MSRWSSAKAKRVLAALLRIGWKIKRESSSHKVLFGSGWLTWSLLSMIKMKLVPKMLARIAKHTGLEPKDL